MQICVVLVFTIVMAAFSPFHAALNFELCFETQCQRHRQWSRHSLEDKQFAIVPDYFAIIHLVRMIQLLVKYSSKWPQGTPLILPRFSVVCLHCRQNRNVVTNVITEHRGSQICIFNNWKQKQYFCTLCTCDFHFCTAAVLVLSTSWNNMFCSCVEKVSTWRQILSLFAAYTNLVPGKFVIILRGTRLLWNNRGMITEMRSYIFKWLSRLSSQLFCRRRNRAVSAQVRAACAPISTLSFSHSTNQHA